MSRPHLANDKDVGEPGGKAVACAILDVHHIKRARVTLPVGDHSNTPQVSTTSHHAQVTWEEAEGESLIMNITCRNSGYLHWNKCNLSFLEPTSVKLDEICNLAGVQVDADCVIDLDEGVWVADGAGIMGHQMGDSFGANDDLLYLAQLVLKNKRWIIRLSTTNI